MKLLRAKDDVASTAVIDFFRGDKLFNSLAKRELEQIRQRDAEDAEKLRAGIAKAIAKGVLPQGLKAPRYESVKIDGKTADEVAQKIIDRLPKGAGCVVVLVGLSGTGKGTTVSKLQAKLPGSTAWSNGNCFRSLTLLAARHCELNGKGDFDPACLTPENIGSWIRMLDFEKIDGEWDIRIRGLGIDEKVSDIKSTLLMEAKVAKNIPAVAEETQGEVVQFAADACERMGDAGVVVLVEGREQTLDFVPSPCRFRLEVADPGAVGARRAAQRVVAEALRRAESSGAHLNVEALLRAALAAVAAT